MKYVPCRFSGCCSCYIQQGRHCLKLIVQGFNHRNEFHHQCAIGGAPICIYLDPRAIGGKLSSNLVYRMQGRKEDGQRQEPGAPLQKTCNGSPLTLLKRKINKADRLFQSSSVLFLSLNSMLFSYPVPCRIPTITTSNARITPTKAMITAATLR